MDLFMMADSYYARPAPGKRETSAEAAKAVSHNQKEMWGAIREVLLAHGPLTGSEIASKLNKSVLVIRPRITEMTSEKINLAHYTGAKRKNTNGKNEMVVSA